MNCNLCKRDVGTITRHHLKPKSRGGARGDVIMLCLSCKDMVHRLIPNKELERQYGSLEKLLSNSKIQTYVKWIKKQKKERVTIATKKRK